jgi:DNA-binding NarL/FixJ family response regulator
VSVSFSRNLAHATSASPWGATLPFVGRTSDLDQLRQHLDDAIDGRGHCVLLTGDAGIGKSRLLAALAHEAATCRVLVASGSAFAAEAGMAFGAIADALSHPLRALDASAITVLARGAEDDLRAVVPGLAGATGTPRLIDPDGSSRARLLWNVTQFLTRLAARQPLLLMLDNAHDADASSLELLHFLARQVAGARILIVLAFVEEGRDSNPVLRGVLRSLLDAREATLQHVGSLTEQDLAELLQRSFALSAADATTHAVTLWSHTRGNPFFVEESLKALVAAGRIRRAGTGWHVEETQLAALAPTVRAAVQARLEVLDARARRVAEIASVIEPRASLALLQRVSGLDAEAFADAIDALCSRRILVERRSAGGADYEFGHPIIQSTVRTSLTAARERALHAGVAAALEALHGPESTEHALAMARHLVQGQDLGDDRRTLHYLSAAGRDALSRRADQEAVRWLGDALQIAERLDDVPAIAALLEERATAQIRMGEGAQARQGWQRALDIGTACGDQLAMARLLHHLGQESARAGDAAGGLALLERAMEVSRELVRPDLEVRAHLACANIQQTQGRHAAAIATVRDALAIATPLGDSGLLAQAHQTALQLYAWTGPAVVARAHGAQALALAAQAGDLDVAWSSHWAMAMLEGFSGNAAGVSRHLREASALADEIASPFLQAMTAEIAIEHASGVGRWDEALATADRIIPMARAIMRRSLLPRLLVWTGLIILERDEPERARASFEEAWQLSGADRIDLIDVHALQDLSNVHNVILAHTGMGMYHLSLGDWARAVEYGERGLALCDRFGYVAWAIHRLIPMLVEAALRTENYGRVEELTAQLRRQATDLNHTLGLAWASAGEALVARVKEKAPDAAARLLAAADALDAVPFVFHAARVRRNAAQVLQADGDIDGAARELRRAHEVFVRLGAEFELRGLRTQLRSLGVRLPPRSVTPGAGALTGRELEIARAVARRLSNKEIGTALDISARTVSTHLSNIFVKLGVDSRGALADVVRADTQLSGG